MTEKRLSSRFGLFLMMLVVLSGGGATTAAADLKVGIINTARILAESAYGKKLQEKFAEEITTQRLELDRKRQEVEKHQNRLADARKSRASESALREITGLLEKSVREFEWLKSDMDKKLTEMDQALLEDMREKVQAILTQYVEDTDYAIVIERVRVAAASTRVDVTSDIIRLMDRRFR